MTTETDQTSVEDLDFTLARAAAVEARGDRQEALRILHTEIPERFGNDQVAYVRSSEKLMQMKHFDEAEDLLRRGAEALPRSPWIPRSQALVARERGEEALALDRFAAVRDSFPDFSTGHADFADSLITLGRADDAEAVTSEAVQAFPGDFWVAYAYARAAEARGDTGAALMRWRALRANWPDNAPALVSELRALIRAGQFAEAGDVLASAAEPPSGVELWREAAERAQQASAWTFAASWWERVRAARPDDEAGFAGGTLALLRMGDAGAARAVFTVARERWPESAALAPLEAELAAYEADTAAPALVEPVLIEPAPVEPAAAPVEPAAPKQVPAAAVAKKPERSRGAFGWLGW